MANTELGRGGAALHGDQAKRMRDVLASVGTAGDDIAALATAMEAAATLVNELKAEVNGLVAKLDADAGVTDTNYAATHEVSSPNVAYTPPA